jgi:hypothetical protein
VTLFLGISPVKDAYLFIRVVQLPGLALILLVEINDEKGVLKVYEEVAHVVLVLGHLFVRNNVNCCVPIKLRFIDLVLELLLLIATRDVLHAKICAQVLPLLHLFNLDWLIVRFLVH